ncbi:MAG: phosphotransferase [Dongiaceae bacterium]
MAGGTGNGGWIAAAIAAARDVEQCAGLNGRAVPHRRHLWTGRTAIADTLLHRPGTRWGEQSFWLRYAGLYANRGRFDRLMPRRLQFLPTGVHADLLSFKTQIRGFYCDRAITFKVSRPGSEMSSRNVANEAAIRVRLKGTDRVGVPAMHAHGAVGSGHFIVEELIADRETMTIRGRLPADAGSALFDFYRVNEFALVPLDAIMDAGHELAMLDAHARNFGFAVPDGTVAFVQREILGDPGAASVMRSLLHGDLTPTNLLSAQQQLYLLDWEHGDIGMTFSDIARLCSVDEKVEQTFLAAAGDWATANSIRMMMPSRQLLLGAIVGVNRRIARGDQGGVAGRSPESKRAYRRKAERFMTLIARILRRERLARADAARNGR